MSMSLEKQTRASEFSQSGEPRGRAVSDMDIPLSYQVSTLRQMTSTSLTRTLSSPELKFTNVTLVAEALHPKVAGQCTPPLRIPNPQPQTRHDRALTLKRFPTLRPTTPDSIIASRNARPTVKTRRVSFEQVGQKVLPPFPVYQLFTSDHPQPVRLPRNENGSKQEVTSQMRDR